MDPSRTKPLIGLAGGIGAGKSAVAEVMGSLGAVVIDSDRLAHQHLCDPSVISQLVSWWGSSILKEDGQVDRRALGNIVFERPAELRRLEALLYPKLEAERRVLVAQALADPAVRAIVLDAPKLVEVGLHEACDVVVVVVAERAVRVRRLLESRGWTEKELERREKLMDPLDKKLALADYVIDNHAGPAELRSQVESVFASALESFL